MIFVLLMIVATTMHGVYMDFDFTFVDVLNVMERQMLISRFIAMLTLARPEYTHTDYCFIAHSQNN